MNCCDNCKEKKPAAFHLTLKRLEPSTLMRNEITLDLCEKCAETFGMFVENGAWRKKK